MVSEKQNLRQQIQKTIHTPEPNPTPELTTDTNMLLIDLGGLNPLQVGPITRQVSLGPRGNLAEHDSKQHSSVVSSSSLGILPWLSLIMDPQSLTQNRIGN